MSTLSAWKRTKKNSQNCDQEKYFSNVFKFWNKIPLYVKTRKMRFYISSKGPFKQQWGESGWKWVKMGKSGWTCGVSEWKCMEVGEKGWRWVKVGESGWTDREPTFQKICQWHILGLQTINIILVSAEWIGSTLLLRKAFSRSQYSN